MQQNAYHACCRNRKPPPAKHFPLNGNPKSAHGGTSGQSLKANYKSPRSKSTAFPCVILRPAHFYNLVLYHAKVHFFLLLHAALSAPYPSWYCSINFPSSRFCGRKGNISKFHSQVALFFLVTKPLFVNLIELAALLQFSHSFVNFANQFIALF